MEKRPIRKGPSFWLSFLLIFLGIYFLLDNFGVIDFNIWNLWPLLLIFAGISKLFSSGFRDYYSSAILLLIGGVFMLDHMGLINIYDLWDYWPVLLILVGGKLIWDQYRSEPETVDRSLIDRVDAVAIFGGKEVRITSDSFQGGSVAAIFGGTEIHLDRARLAKGEHILDIFAMFGGVDIYLPDHWNVVIRGIPIFGGYEDSRRPPVDAEIDTERTLVIKGLVIFGGIDIKSAGSK